MSNNSTDLRWDDYMAVFLLADMISASLVHGLFFQLILGSVLYILYEQMRKKGHW